MATHFRKKKVELFHKQTLFEHTTQIYQNPMEIKNIHIHQEYTKDLYQCGDKSFYIIGVLKENSNCFQNLMTVIIIVYFVKYAFHKHLNLS